MLRIKELCAERNMSIKELAVLLKKHPVSFSRMINGNPTLKSLQEIAGALEVEVQDLFTSEEPKGTIEYKGEMRIIRSADDLAALLKEIQDG